MNPSSISNQIPPSAQGAQCIPPRLPQVEEQISNLRGNEEQLRILATKLSDRLEKIVAKSGEKAFPNSPEPSIVPLAGELRDVNSGLLTTIGILERILSDIEL